MVPTDSDVWTFCQCRKQKELQRRIQSSLIPEEFKGCNLDNYQLDNPVQRALYDAAVEYITNFESIKGTANNSLGFLAVVGEKTLNDIPSNVERAEKKIVHNSFGLGKTHLQIAIARELIDRGLSVLVINDVPFMNELTQAQFLDDDGDQLIKLLRGVKTADVLIWDDLGKKKTSEYMRNRYYEIIDHRWRNRLPTCFSSNEDADTLADKIGDASASRLLSMCRGRLVQVEGPDFRLK